jgi:hypothetical protein
MRAFMVAVLLALSAPIAFADDIDAATMKAISALATKGYADPASAEIRNVHKSLASNGMGYCGEVTVQSGGGVFTPFHVILGEGTGASVLRLVDYPPSDTDNYAEAVNRMMKNFGCTE